MTPDRSSQVLITFYRGDLYFVNNSFSDGGAVQLYGASTNCIMMGNKCARVGGFSAWGLNPHKLYWQPSMYNLFINNTISEGNCWANTAAAFFSISDSAAPVPMVRYNVWRRNKIDNNASFSIGGSVEDSLYEKNTVANSGVAFLTTGTGVGVANVLRKNVLQSCPTLISGPGASKFKQF